MSSFAEDLKERKNAMNRKIKYGVLVVCENGFHFATRTNLENKSAEWIPGEPVQTWASRRYAADIALGLYHNGTPAMVVEVPSYLAGVKNF